jgi:hypothetical protein
VIAQGKRPGDSAYVETYDPDIDSATLAQPKHGGAASAGGGAAMKGSVKTPLLPSGVTDANTVFGSSGANPFKNYDPNNTKTRRPKAGLTQVNWMSEYAHGIAAANKDIAAWRQARGRRITLGNDHEAGPDGDEDDVVEGEAAAVAAAVTQGTDAQQGSGFHADGQDTKMEQPATATAAVTVNKHKRPRPRLVGIYESHTNLPHVRLDFEPTRAVLERLSSLPEIPLLPDEGGGVGGGDGMMMIDEDEEQDPEEVKRRRLEVARAGASIGLATVVYEMETNPEGQDVDTRTTIPGLWDFRSGITV